MAALRRRDRMPKMVVALPGGRDVVDARVRLTEGTRETTVPLAGTGTALAGPQSTAAVARHVLAKNAAAA
jgi:hypothetical protein